MVGMYDEIKKVWDRLDREAAGRELSYVTLALAITEVLGSCSWKWNDDYTEMVLEGCMVFVREHAHDTAQTDN